MACGLQKGAHVTPSAEVQTMSKRPRSSDNEAFETVAIPVAAALDGVEGDVAGKAQGVVEWSAKHFTASAQERPDEAETSEADDLVGAVARLENDIAEHRLQLVGDREDTARRHLGYALGGLLVGGLLGGAIVAALHARR